MSKGYATPRFPPALRLSLLMPSNRSHNLMVRGSNPCGGTNHHRIFLPWREDGAIVALRAIGID